MPAPGLREVERAGLGASAVGAAASMSAGAVAAAPDDAAVALNAVRVSRVAITALLSLASGFGFAFSEYFLCRFVRASPALSIRPTEMLWLVVFPFLRVACVIT